MPLNSCQCHVCQFDTALKMDFKLVHKQFEIININSLVVLVFWVWEASGLILLIHSLISLYSCWVLGLLDQDFLKLRILSPHQWSACFKGSFFKRSKEYSKIGITWEQAFKLRKFNSWKLNAYWRLWSVILEHRHKDRWCNPIYNVQCY